MHNERCTGATENAHSPASNPITIHPLNVVHAWLDCIQFKL